MSIKISELPINSSPIFENTTIVGVDSSSPSKISVQIPLTALSSIVTQNTEPTNKNLVWIDTSSPDPSSSFITNSANNQILQNRGGSIYGASLEWDETNKGLRIKNNSTNYWDANVSTTGSLTFKGVGTNANISFTPTAGQNITLFTSLGGGVGINGSPLTSLTVVETSASSPRGILSQQISTDANGSRVGCSKARGTISGPSVVYTGDMIGRHIFRGHDGSNYLEMASLDVGVSGTVATTRVPTYMVLNTSTDATPSVLSEAVRIDNTQSVGVGTGSVISAKLHVISTTEQQRIGYDASDYWKQVVGSTGLMTWSGVGTGGALTITPTSGQNVNILLAGTGKTTIGDGGTTNYLEINANGTVILHGQSTIPYGNIPVNYQTFGGL